MTKEQLENLKFNEQLDATEKAEQRIITAMLIICIILALFAFAIESPLFH